MSFLGTVAILVVGVGAASVAVVKTKEFVEDKVIDFEIFVDDLFAKKVFNKPISYSRFKDIVQGCKGGIPRLQNLEVYNSRVMGTVASKSGLSEWKFSIDFDDHGKITGWYSIHSENEDSAIPKALAERIRKQIKYENERA